MVMVKSDRFIRAAKLLRTKFSVFENNSALAGLLAYLKEGFAAQAPEQQACINQLGSTHVVITLQAAIEQPKKEQPKNETLFSVVMNRSSRRVLPINPITLTGTA